jgi:CheY-like chemotaxis protein
MMRYGFGCVDKFIFIRAAGRQSPLDRGEVVGLGGGGLTSGLIMLRVVPPPPEPPADDYAAANAWEVVNFNSLLRSIAPILRQVAGNKVTLELRLASDLGQTRITPTLFQQVLLKLCAHAKKTLPDGGKIIIRTANHIVVNPVEHSTAAMKAGRYIALTISDPEQGLTPRVVENLLELIQTGSDQGAAPAHRYGHVQRTTEELGFVLYLPETMEGEVTARSRPGASPLSRGPESLLIIEANVVLRKMITGLLTFDGYQVSAVATAAQARGQLAGKLALPQLVFMSRGGKVELQFVRQLLAANKQLRLINAAADHPWRRFADFPAQHLIHLPKPFALNVLFEQIRILLDAAR